MSVYERLYIKLFKGSRLLMAIKRSVSMILSYATFIGLIVWLFSIVIPDLISSLSSLLVIDTGALAKLVNNLNENKQISEALNYMGTDKDLVSTLSGYSQQILKQVLSVLTNLLTSVSSIAATLLNVFVSFIFSIYVLANKEQLGRQFNLLIDTYLGSTGKTFHYVRHILHQRFHGFCKPNFRSYDFRKFDGYWYVDFPISLCFNSWGFSCFYSSNTGCGSLHWCYNRFHLNCY